MVLFESDRVVDDDRWQNFIAARRKLYNYLKPIIKELPVYYHADQECMELLGYTDSMEEFEKFRVEHKLNYFNLSDFILNPDFNCVPDAYETVFLDDFKDIS